jgi:hypothetical protein
MKRCRHLVTFVVTFLLIGCGKPSTGSVTVVPGQGIPKVAEVTMSLSEIQDAVGDLNTRTYPETGLPWQKDVIGERRRLPWERPHHFTAVSQSLGLYCSARDRDTPVQSLVFFSDPDPIAVKSNVWFTGELSCGISFANRRRVTRKEIVEKFGEASVQGVELRTNLWPLLQAGTSVSDKSGTGNGVEDLYYPSDGISFCLRHDFVISFHVRQKIRKEENKK